MEKPKWIAGNENKFSEFIDSLNEEDLIAIVSHKADLDGIISAKVVSKVVQFSEVFLVDYNDLNKKFITLLKNKGFTKIIITDMNFKNKEDINLIEAFAKLLIIDHHQFKEDFNSEKTVFMNAQGMCAAYLSYSLFSEFKNLKDLEWAVACASLSDWAWKQNGDFLSDVFSEYGDKFVGTEEDVKKNKFWEFQYSLYLALIYYKNNIMEFYEMFPEKFEEIGILSEHTLEVQKELNEVLIFFDNERKMVNKRIFWEFHGKFSLRELLINIKSHEEKNKTFVICEKSSGIYKCSFRRQDAEEDVSILAQKLVEVFENSGGGGHKAASGCSFPEKFMSEFLERLEKL